MYITVTNEQIVFRNVEQTPNTNNDSDKSAEKNITRSRGESQTDASFSNVYDKESDLKKKMKFTSCTLVKKSPVKMLRSVDIVWLNTVDT